MNTRSGMLTKLGDMVLLRLFQAVGVIILVLLLPIYMLAYPCRRYRRWRFDIGYREFLRTHEGARYFVYTPRVKVKDFIELEIIPRLDKDITIVNMSNLCNSYIHRTVSDQRPVGGYPYIVYIKDGQPRSHSLNTSLYRALSKNDSRIVLNEVDRLQGMSLG